MREWGVLPFWRFWHWGPLSVCIKKVEWEIAYFWGSVAKTSKTILLVLNQLKYNEKVLAEVLAYGREKGGFGKKTRLCNYA
jgi:hypothetical protein